MDHSSEKIAIIGLGYVGSQLILESGKQRNALGFYINVARIAAWPSICGNTLHLAPAQPDKAGHLPSTSAPFFMAILVASAGSFVLDWRTSAGEPDLNLGRLAYAGSLARVKGYARKIFAQINIGKAYLVERLVTDADKVAHRFGLKSSYSLKRSIRNARQWHSKNRREFCFVAVGNSCMLAARVAVEPMGKNATPLFRRQCRRNRHESPDGQRRSVARREYS